MEAGSVTFSTALDNKQLEKDLNALARKIEKKERDIADLTVRRDQAKEKSLFDLAALDKEKAKLQGIKDHLADIRTMSKDKTADPETRAGYAAQIPALRQEQADQQVRVNALQKEWTSTENAVDRYNGKISEAEKDLSRMKEEAGYLTKRLDEAGGVSEKLGAAMERADARLNRFGKRLKNIALSALVFNVISAGLRQLVSWTGKAVQTSDAVRRSIAQLKGALLTLAQPLVEVIIPAFTLLVNVVTKLITIAARLVSALFGKTLQQSKDGAKALYKEAKAMGAVGDAAEEAAGSLAGFDEINAINTENASGTGGGVSADIAPDFDFNPGKYMGMVDELLVYLSGALLVIGAILFFSGANIPLGLGLMVLGAAGLASEVAENWGAADGKVRDAINRVLVLTGLTLLVIGAILTFSGANIPLGIGLMALGASMLWTALALNWGGLSAELQAALTAVMAIVGAAALVIGAILAFSGANVPLGIALMAIGAAMLASAVALNWDSISAELKSALSEILVIVGEFLLVLGVLLVFSGANIPLGIALIVSGAAALAGAAALDWDNVSSEIQEILSELLTALGTAVLVLGVLLVFSGANIPLGIGLLIVGAATLAAGAALNWDEVSGQIQTVISVLTGMISVAFLALGAILTFSGANIPLGIALLVLGISGVGLASLNWDAVESALKGPIGKVTAIAGAALLALGVIICFSGVGLPLGIALIAAGAAGLVTVTALNWNAIQEKLGDVWKGIRQWWDQNVAKYLTLDYWKGKGGDIIDGFKKGLKDAWDSLANWWNGVWDSLFGNRKVSVSADTSTASASVPPHRAAAMPDIVNYNIPALAQGAVIPPNREFLAVLGDQRSGNNLEGPEDLFRQIVREESGGTTAELLQLLRAILATVKEGHVIMVDGTAFGRTAIRTINSVNTAAGKQQLIL